MFSLDENTGEPKLIQHIDTRGIEARTFAVDPGGKLLIAANQKAILVESQAGLDRVDANFAIFRIGSDGKLEFVRKYEVNADKRWLLWMDVLNNKTGKVRSNHR